MILHGGSNKSGFAVHLFDEADHEWIFETFFMCEFVDRQNDEKDPDDEKHGDHEEAYHDETKSEGYKFADEKNNLKVYDFLCRRIEFRMIFAFHSPEDKGREHVDSRNKPEYKLTERQKIAHDGKFPEFPVHFRFIFRHLYVRHLQFLCIFLIHELLQYQILNIVHFQLHSKALISILSFFQKLK